MHTFATNIVLWMYQTAEDIDRTMLSNPNMRQTAFFWSDEHINQFSIIVPENAEQVVVSQISCKHVSRNRNISIV